MFQWYYSIQLPKDMLKNISQNQFCVISAIKACGQKEEKTRSDREISALSSYQMTHGNMGPKCTCLTVTLHCLSPFLFQGDTTVDNECALVPFLVRIGLMVGRRTISNS